MKPFRLEDHFRPIPDDPEGGLYLSAAATIWLAYDALFDMEDGSEQGRANARELIRACMAVFRAARFPKVGYLETWLDRPGADVCRVLPVLAEACDAVDCTRLMESMNRAMRDDDSAT
ncbi:hypothetical protein ACEU07_03770 [Chromobacterium violaceum]|uniref:hypothetical protein n=1 Tax=Chromobacterium violaceum TaxID=536 RepID=UPI001C8BEB6A|nr:hypothetical protein [Chromobacterium violaceum]MBX9267498.1 hypothetical protein [Chromobacterium violaceum]